MRGTAGGRVGCRGGGVIGAILNASKHTRVSDRSNIEDKFWRWFQEQSWRWLIGQFSIQHQKHCLRWHRDEILGYAHRTVVKAVPGALLKVTKGAVLEMAPVAVVEVGHGSMV